MSVKKKNVGNIRDLIVYRKTLLFRKDIYAIIKTMPSSEWFIMKNDLRKASCAVCANLTEGNASFYYGREYEHFDIALCKLVKCQALLDIGFSQDFVKEEEYNRLQENAKEIARMISALMKRKKHSVNNEVEPTSTGTFSTQFTESTILDSTIYEKAKLFQDAIKNMVGKLPEEESDNVVDQIVRAVSSVYENLIKSKGIISDKRFQELDYSLGSISEVRSFLDISVMEKFITKEEYLRKDEDAGIIQSVLIDQMEELNKRLK